MFNWRQKLEAKRFVGGGYVDGVWQEPESTEIAVYSSLQPTSPTDQELLPEGKRGRKSYTLIGPTVLRTANDEQQADRVKIEGEWFEVSSVEVWANRVLPHCKAVVTRMPEQPDD